MTRRSSVLSLHFTEVISILMPMCVSYQQTLWVDVQHSLHGPFARYAKVRVAHAPGMPGTFSPPPRVTDPDMHHGTCLTHVPWCMPGSLNSGFLWSRWRGKRSRHSRRMEFYVSGKRPMIRSDWITSKMAYDKEPFPFVYVYWNILLKIKWSLERIFSVTYFCLIWNIYAATASIARVVIEQLFVGEKVLNWKFCTPNILQLNGIPWYMGSTDAI